MFLDSLSETPSQLLVLTAFRGGEVASYAGELTSASSVSVIGGSVEASSSEAAVTVSLSAGTASYSTVATSVGEASVEAGVDVASSSSAKASPASVTLSHEQPSSESPSLFLHSSFTSSFIQSNELKTITCLE